MLDRDRTLELYREQLEDLVKNHDDTKKKLRCELNPTSKNALEREIQGIIGDIENVEEKIKRRESESKVKFNQESREKLAGILKGRDSYLEQVLKAYHQTINHWRVGKDLKAGAVDSILDQLEKIPPGQSSHTAREEFIAYLIAMPSEDGLLANTLCQWAKDYRNERNWLELHAQIQAEQRKQLQNAQPAIFITITRSDEVSTQSQSGETFYQMKAWLAEDIETYQKYQTGYHALITSGSAQAEPCRLEELLQAVPRFMQQCIDQKEQHCLDCQNYPEVHVFLPIELMHLGVEVWQLNPEPSQCAGCLGHDHVVVLRCAERYTRNYTKAPSWRRFWSNRYQKLRQSPAQLVFTSGNDDSLNALLSLLDAAVQASDESIVGLHLTQAPIDTEAMCYQLLDSGLPLAIWPRQTLLNVACENDLPALLAACCCLEELPQMVQRKRYESRRWAQEPHIGHHLSLLWDNPHLVPPKSA